MGRKEPGEGTSVVGRRASCCAASNGVKRADVRGTRVQAAMKQGGRKEKRSERGSRETDREARRQVKWVQAPLPPVYTRELPRIGSDGERR